MFDGCEVLSDVPVYVVDFDLPPEERWMGVMEDYKDKLGDAMEYLREVEQEDFGILGPFLVSVVTTAARCRTFSNEEMAEIRSIAKVTKEYGVSEAQLIKLNIGYDLLARCTSVVTQDQSGSVWHTRTMDWDLPSMRDITINLIIRKNGQEIAKVTTWPAYIGFLTAIRLPDNEDEKPWSISLNYRKIKGTSDLDYSSNFYHICKASLTVSMAMRNAILHKKTYTDAVAYLSSVQVIAPCYMIICGSNINEGVILTRGRKDCRALPLENFLVQTNIDWDDNEAPEKWVDDDELLLSSVDRRNAATENLQNLLVAKESIEHTDLLKLLLTPPVYNEQTIYVTVANPAKQYYLSLVSEPPTGSSSL